jgi:hypothetical protein
LNQENITILDTKKGNPRNRVLVGTPTLGIIRFEWAAARFGQIIPCNWSTGQLPVGVPAPHPIEGWTVMGCLVADAQNVIVQEVVEKNYEWLFLHEDDVILPKDTYVKINEYMNKGDVPVVSGLYYLKNNPSEPIMYRGRGNSYFQKWKLGKKVWVDGVPTGCLLIHGSILKKMWKESKPYTVAFPGLVKKVRKVFEEPRKAWVDPETKSYKSAIGTSDLYWCDRVMDEKFFEKAGWPEYQKKKYPFLCDTSLLCQHIDLTTGRQYPGPLGD